MIVKKQQNQKQQNKASLHYPGHLSYVAVLGYNVGGHPLPGRGCPSCDRILSNKSLPFLAHQPCDHVLFNPYHLDHGPCDPVLFNPWPSWHTGPMTLSYSILALWNTDPVTLSYSILALWITDPVTLSYSILGLPGTPTL